MEKKQLLERLETGRRSILATLAQAESALDGPAFSRVQALASIQWRLMRELRGYQLTKHAEVFDRTCRGGSERQIRLAAEMKDRCVQLGVAYNRHFMEWSGRSDNTAWPRFEAETRALFLQIRNQLAREAVEVAQLL